MTSSADPNRYLLLALGNPGEKYVNTRHNAGWLLLDAAYPDLDWKSNAYSNATEAITHIAEKKVTCIKPFTFMNESGKSLVWHIKKAPIAGDHIIVLQDDVDLALGRLKISYDRGDGGHNGLRSIAAHLKSNAYIRIRIGISKTGEDGALYKPNVLGNFEPSELETLKNLAPTLRNQIEMILKEGREKAQSMTSA